MKDENPVQVEADTVADGQDDLMDMPTDLVNSVVQQESSEPSAIVGNQPNVSNAQNKNPKNPSIADILGKAFVPFKIRGCRR